MGHNGYIEKSIRFYFGFFSKTLKNLSLKKAWFRRHKNQAPSRIKHGKYSDVFASLTPDQTALLTSEYEKCPFVLDSTGKRALYIFLIYLKKLHEGLKKKWSFFKVYIAQYLRHFWHAFVWDIHFGIKYFYYFFLV